MQSFSAALPGKTAGDARTLRIGEECIISGLVIVGAVYMDKSKERKAE